ncbi:MAG: LacI family DNA-binding transcriptional regulator [Sphaerochaeta sp.]|nr:LacI family DNA-binding transcriptional regulator [Sphaerochaeta sp.]
MPITRDSVAKRAGVSSATVSRVYNTPQTVSSDLRTRVLEAAQELGYTPNSCAATLRRKGTGNLAFVEFSKQGRAYYWGSLNSFDWFFGRALRGIQQVIEHSSYQVRFYSVSTKEEVEELAKQCDGIIAYDVDTEEELSFLSGLPIPVVASHHLHGISDIACVRTDNYQGGVLQAEYLKSLGCTHPLYVSGYLESVEPHRQRLAGFRSLYPEAELLTTEIGSAEARRELVGKVKQIAHQFDSLAAVNDLTLFSILLNEKLGVPSVGYDASPYHSLFLSQVASIDLDSGAIYREAGRMLLSLLAGEEKRCVTIAPVLVHAQQERATIFST